MLHLTPRLPAWLLAVAAVSLSTACGVPCRSESAALTLGTGAQDFEDLADGDSLAFYQGPQGGHHIFVSLRAQGIFGGREAFDPNNPRLTVSVEWDGQTLAEIADRPNQLPDQGDDEVGLIGQLLVLMHPNPPVLTGEPATYRASVTDACGLTATDELDVELSLEREL